MANRPFVADVRHLDPPSVPSNSPHRRRFSWEQPVDADPFTFSAPSESLIPWTEVMRERELRQNVHGMFDFEPKSQGSSSDGATFRTDRAYVPDGEASGRQTPRPNNHRTYQDIMPKQEELDSKSSSLKGSESSDENDWKDIKFWPGFENGQNNSPPPQPMPFPPPLPDEFDFLKDFPNGDATITFFKDDGTEGKMTGLHKSSMVSRCELLDHVFELEARRSLHLHLDMLSERSAIPFIRYLHIGVYARNEKAKARVYDEPPTPLLVHVELFRLGKHFELPDLVNQVRGNLHVQTEFGCSSPEKPKGLVASIRFIYQHAKEFGQDYDDVLDIIVNYCVACFRTNHLADDAGFKELFLENTDLYHRMYKNSLARDEETCHDHTSVTAEIIQLSFETSGQKTPVPSLASRNPWALSPKSPSTQLSGLNDLELLSPHRKRRAVRQMVKEEGCTDSEAYTASEADDDFSIIRKRGQTINPFESVEDTDSSQETESEYEVVAGPSRRVHAMSSAEPSDAESDWEQLPRVLPVARHLPIRTTGRAPALDHPEHDDADQSESEWDRLSEA